MRRLSPGPPRRKRREGAMTKPMAVSGQDAVGGLVGWNGDQS